MISKLKINIRGSNPEKILPIYSEALSSEFEERKRVKLAM